jgi:hypothetical protein
MGRSVHPVYYSNSNKKLYLNYDEKEPTFFNTRRGMGQTPPVRSAGSDETLSFEVVALPPASHN